jgi:hypothetical protein
MVTLGSKDMPTGGAPVRCRVLLACLLLGFGVPFTPPPLYGQSASDSLAVMEAVGRSLAGHPVAAVASRFACYHAPRCAPEDLASPSATRLLQTLSRTANVRLSTPSAFVPAPACPSREGADDGGYLLHVGIPQIREDGAIVAVARACTWSATGRDPILTVGEEYILERRDGGWDVVQRRPTWRS